MNVYSLCLYQEIKYFNISKFHGSQNNVLRVNIFGIKKCTMTQQKFKQLNIIAFQSEHKQYGCEAPLPRICNKMLIYLILHSVNNFSEDDSSLIKNCSVESWSFEVEVFVNVQSAL